MLLRAERGRSEYVEREEPWERSHRRQRRARSAMYESERWDEERPPPPPEPRRPLRRLHTVDDSRYRTRVRDTYLVEYISFDRVDNMLVYFVDALRRER